MTKNLLELMLHRSIYVHVYWCCFCVCEISAHWLT